MVTAMKSGFYNPSSLYAPGIAAQKEMDACRNLVKKKLAAQDVVFTSGGTEANNLAVLGLLNASRKTGRVLYSQGEHPAVREPVKSLSGQYDTATIPLLSSGLLDLDALHALLTHDTVLICVMHINNEVGAIQPLSAVIALRNEKCPDALIHVDGVQGFLREAAALSGGIDSYALSAHKIHGPKGIGALALGSRAKISAYILGGGQENARRSGTENTPGIAGLKAAIEAFPASNDMRLLKLRLYHSLLDSIPDLAVNGPDPASQDACDHILNVSFPQVRGETMMHALEGMGVYVSHTAACSSRKRSPSATLTGMNLSRERQESAVRFSLSPYTTHDEIDYAARCSAQAWQSLRKYSRK